MARRRLAAVPAYQPDPFAAEGEAAAARQWLVNADDAFLACRGNHNFPKLRLHSGRLPAGIRADRNADRSYQITETCPDCGTKRTYSTIPGGYLTDAGASYVYDWPEGYRMPKGASSHVSIRDCKGEEWRRVEEELEAAQVRREAAAAKRRARRGK